MKRKITIVAVIACFLALAIAGGTLAYFTAQDEALNEIIAGDFNVILHDEDGNGDPFVTVTGVMPGDVVRKVVHVENASTTNRSDAWVRVRLTVTVLAANSTEEEPVYLDNSMIHLSINTNNYIWTQRPLPEDPNDTWYYYERVLPVDTITENLLNSVTLDALAGNEYQNCTIYVNVEMQAVQVANNGEVVFDATGWPEA